MKQFSSALALLCLSLAAICQEDSMKTRHDKIYQPVTAEERPVEIITASTEKTAELVKSHDPALVKKQKTASKKKLPARKVN